MEEITPFPESIEEILRLYQEGRITKETILERREFHFGGKIYCFLDNNEPTPMMNIVEIIRNMGKEESERVYFKFEGEQLSPYRTRITLR